MRIDRLIRDLGFEKVNGTKIFKIKEKDVRSYCIDMPGVFFFFDELNTSGTFAYKGEVVGVLRFRDLRSYKINKSATVTVYIELMPDTRRLYNQKLTPFEIVDFFKNQNI